MQTMGGKPQQLLNSKIQFNAPLMTKQPQKHAANQYVDSRGIPNADVASAALQVGRMQFMPMGAATSSGQPSPIISTKRVPQKILDATVSGNMSPNQTQHVIVQKAVPVKKNNFVGNDQHTDMIHI